MKDGRGLGLPVKNSSFSFQCPDAGNFLGNFDYTFILPLCVIHREIADVKKEEKGTGEKIISP
jgi:hypothetical protein